MVCSQNNFYSSLVMPCPLEHPDEISEGMQAIYRDSNWDPHRGMTAGGLHLPSVLHLNVGRQCLALLHSQETSAGAGEELGGTWSWDWWESQNLF